MTFYNVLLGILFMGAIQQLLQAIWNGEALNIAIASALFLSIASDGIMTSHLVESEMVVKYRARLMTLDTINFLLLAVIIVALRPSHNLFDLQVTNGDHSWLALLVLGAYWLLIVVWSQLSGFYETFTTYPHWLKEYSCWSAVTLVIVGLLMHNGQAAWVKWGAGICCCNLSAYILVVRPLAWSRLELRKAPPALPCPCTGNKTP